VFSEVDKTQIGLAGRGMAAWTAPSHCATAAAALDPSRSQPPGYIQSLQGAAASTHTRCCVLLEIVDATSSTRLHPAAGGGGGQEDK
jgi:hypothetical protein